MIRKSSEENLRVYAERRGLFFQIRLQLSDAENMQFIVVVYLMKSGKCIQQQLMVLLWLQSADRDDALPALSRKRRRHIA